MSLDTFEKQKAFFESRWPELELARNSGGISGMLRAIAQEQDAQARRVLFVFARTGLLKRGDAERLDDLIALSEAAQRELRAEIEDAGTDEDTRSKRLRTLHAVYFNLAADLAMCWPDDDEPRERRHLEHGVRAATNALEINERLQSDAGVFANDWWIRGVHELFLGDPAHATSLASALKFAKAQAEADGASPEIGADAPYLLLCTAGSDAVAAMRRDEEGARERYEAVCAALEAQCADESRKHDAQFGLDQLRTLEQRLTG